MKQVTALESKAVSPQGAQKFYALHPSAQYLDIILPDPANFSRAMRQAGVNDDTLVVVSGRFADIKELAAGARLYWTIKVFGHEKVALLNGGVAK